MSVFKSFKYRNTQIINYGSGDTQPSGPTSKINQVVTDWDRYATATETCPYYINGQNLATLTKGTGFLPKRTINSRLKAALEKEDETEEEKEERIQQATIEERERQTEGRENLERFFEMTLFNQVKNVEQRNHLVQAAMKHFHQAGLPHATNLSINAQNDTKYKLKDPERRINFEWTDKGLIITEENTYKKWSDMTPKGKPIEHVCRRGKPYYAETKTTYLLTPDSDIKLIDLEINCPSRKLASIFDKREAHEQPYRYLKDIINYFLQAIHIQREVIDSKLPDAQTIYEDHPQNESPSKSRKFKQD
ncbi:MAG: hypothetical protein K0U37_04480 [Gammaproteobacteria bacterium]|nr:hypothetical protein [Gammaproteobacteria bacterium]